MIDLPCRPGDTIYVLRWHTEGPCIRAHKCTALRIDHNGVIIQTTKGNVDPSEVYPTLEAAVAAVAANVTAPLTRRVHGLTPADPLVEYHTATGKVVADGWLSGSWDVYDEERESIREFADEADVQAFIRDAPDDIAWWRR